MTTVPSPQDTGRGRAARRGGCLISAQSRGQPQLPFARLELVSRFGSLGAERLEALTAFVARRKAEGGAPTGF
jgi:hypothetical protein